MLIIITAIFSPWISPHNPLKQNIIKRFSEPSKQFLGGTDRYGRDIFSRTLWGSRVSLTVGFSATFIGAFLGTFLGLIAGYTKGRMSRGIMWLTDVFMSFPTMVLAIIVVVAFGPGTQNVILAIGLAFTPRFIRLARASTLATSEQD